MRHRTFLLALPVLAFAAMSVLWGIPYLWLAEIFLIAVPILFHVLGQIRDAGLVDVGIVTGATDAEVRAARRRLRLVVFADVALLAVDQARQVRAGVHQQRNNLAGHRCGQSAAIDLMLAGMRNRIVPVKLPVLACVKHMKQITFVFLNLAVQ